MSKININDITTQYGFKDAINARLQQIEDEFNNKVFYRNNPTGEPNSLNNDLDMGNNDILNINKITVKDIGAVGESSFKELIEEAKQAVVDCTEQTTLSALQANASAYSAGQSASSATSAASSASEAQDAATIATTVISPATTTTRGIGRIATSADLVNGATINNGPAFLAAGVHTSVAAAAGKVPVADSNGKLDAWVSPQTQYAACATAAATAAKVAGISNFQLVKGSRVFVTFSNANTVANAITLNVNSTGAKTVYNERGATSASNPAVFPAGVPIEFVYDGNYWRYLTLPSVPAAISTCTTTGDWTITGCKIGVPLDIICDITSPSGGGDNMTTLYTKSGATGGTSAGNGDVAYFGLGRYGGWYSSSVFRCYPVSATVVIHVGTIHGTTLTAMQ